MPLPAAKETGNPVLKSDIEALAAYADSLGLLDLANAKRGTPVSWDYTVGDTNWLYEDDDSPGVFNRIRRDLMWAHLEVDAQAGARGWPEACLVSGPWCMPPSSFEAIPGTGPSYWAGVFMGGAGTYAQIRQVRCFAAEEIVRLRARADVSHTSPGGVDGEGAAYLNLGWSGTYDGGLFGWRALTFSCDIAPSGDVIAYQGSGTGKVWVDLPSSPDPGVSATLQGSAASVSDTDLGGGVHRYAVDVTGISGATGLEVVFTWSEDVAASAWGAAFSVQHDYSAATTVEAIAEAPWVAFAEDDFRVTASGAGWLVGDVWIWPEFAEEDDRGNEQFCLMAKTLPVSLVYHHDLGLVTPRLAPRWSGKAYHPECLNAVMQRSDQGNADGSADANGRVRDGIENGGLEPSWTVPTSPGSYRCGMVIGVWVARRGFPVKTHAPIVPEIGADSGPDVGPEVEVEVGCWRGGSVDDGDVPWVYHGGTFNVGETVTLGAKRAYQFFQLDPPWPALENKALVWGADPDVVEVTGVVVCEVAMPLTGEAVEDDWDAGWPGSSGSAGPVHGFSSAPATAIWNDTRALLGLL